MNPATDTHLSANGRCTDASLHGVTPQTNSDITQIFWGDLSGRRASRAKGLQAFTQITHFFFYIEEKKEREVVLLFGEVLAKPLRELSEGPPTFGTTASVNSQRDLSELRSHLREATPLGGVR